MKIENIDMPKIEDPRDVILKVTSTAICGSDLHIYNGLIPQPEKMVLGHEFMGLVEETGSDVHKVKVGDRVVVPFPIACGYCYFCQKGLTPHCENSNPNYGPEGGQVKQKGGALYGYTDMYGGYNGGQAEYVRVLYADFNLRKVPEGLTDDQVLFLTDIFPTGWSAVDWAKPQGGETIAVFGCGPVGIMAQKSAWLRGADKVIGIDLLPYRLKIAQDAANSTVINGKEQDPVQVIRDMTEGRGADIVIDAVGMEADRGLLDKVSATVHGEGGTIEVFGQAVSAVRRGGTVIPIGVYGTSYSNFPLGQIFDKGLRLAMGQATVQYYIDDLMELVRMGKVRLDDIITHKVPLDEGVAAYDVFNKKEEDCLKVVLNP